MDGELKFEMEAAGTSVPQMCVLPQPHYEQFPRFAEAMATADEKVQLEAMAFFLPEFHNRYRWLLSAPRRDFDARIGPGDEILNSLQNEGVALGRIDASVKARLVELTSEIAQGLQSTLNDTACPSFKDGQMILDFDQHSEIHRVIEEAFVEANIFDVASAYVGDEVKLGLTALQVNTPSSTRFRYGKIGADGLPKRTRTDYYHIDSAGWPHVKVLIYLNQVGLDQGPFRYIPGSHRIATDYELAVRKTNDKLKTPARLFMALPAPFRLQADFGTYMDLDSPEARVMLSNERAIYDAAGSDIVLFDYHGVHRGGFSRLGPRHILQCNFAPRNEDGPAARAAVTKKDRQPR